MDKNEFKRERMYQSAMYVVRVLRNKGLVNDNDYMVMESRLAEKYKPVIGRFFLT